MIALFTDFGVTGPYIGQMKAVLNRQAPEVAIIDLLADAPRYNPRAAAYLLASLVCEFPKDCVFLCVIDPGVGNSNRLPVVVRANEQWFIGPDNGLFNTIQKHYKSTFTKWCITWVPEKFSNSFHGRDLFAPIAAQIALGNCPPGDHFRILPEIVNAWPDDLNECIYIDTFGNVVSGRRADTVRSNSIVVVNKQALQRHNTFSDVCVGQAFWYKNSNGLMEIAVNQGSAADQLKVRIGDKISIQES